MNEYDTLLKQYPEYVSKRTARYYLLTGLIPCVDNGKKTRNYQIKMTDIVVFLQVIPYNYNYRIPKIYLIDFVAHMESGSLWGRRTVGYKQRINDYAIWKLKKGNAGGRGK